MNVEKFAEKLGIQRTKIVLTKKLGEQGPKDANDALIEDPDSII